MEHYFKGRNVEEILEKNNIPIPSLPEKFIWMHIKPGTKIRNVMSFALKAFKDERNIVWSGSGAALEKTITCVEVMKRRYKSLHQISKICYLKVEEHWEPKLEGLDELVVVREVPTIHIFLSKDLLDSNENGYQAPGSANSFFKSEFTSEKPWAGHRGDRNSQAIQRNQNKGPKRKIDQSFKRLDEAKSEVTEKDTSEKEVLDSHDSSSK